MDRVRRSFRNVMPDSKAAQEFDRFDRQTKQLPADMFVDMTMDAGKKLSTIKSAGMTGKITTDRGSVRYSIKSDKVIDLSSNNELSERTEGLHGAEKYKEIQRYILEVLQEQLIMLSDGREAVVDRRDALHIANRAGGGAARYGRDPSADSQGRAAACRLGKNCPVLKLRTGLVYWRLVLILIALKLDNF